MFDFLRDLFPDGDGNKNGAPLKWSHIRHQPVTYVGDKEIAIGNRQFGNSILDFNQEFGAINVADLAQQVGKYGGGHPLTQPIIPQLASLIYDVTQNPSAMAMYFPLLNTMNVDDRHKFYETVNAIILNPNFELYVWDSELNDISVSAPPSIAFIVAGHIVEIMYSRRELLYQFFRGQRIFNLYMSEVAYINDGGVGGGCYVPQSGSIKLKVSRLFEGYFQPIPGVAPFLHEFGHMLDHYHVKSRQLGVARGLLPGMRVDDGALYDENCRDKFLAGKRLELDKYNNMRRKPPQHKTDMPIGHPYVFQNDGEFIAGYLEMFFRNPFYFAEMNPTLFDSLVLLFKQDPRDYVKQDFDGYINQNRQVYIGRAQTIPEAGLKLL